MASINVGIQKKAKKQKKLPAEVLEMVLKNNEADKIETLIENDDNHTDEIDFPLELRETYNRLDSIELVSEYPVENSQ